jgi:ribosome assembly protein RRB1
MQVDSDEASEGPEYYTESEGDSDIICDDDDYLDKSEDFEEVEGDGPLQEKLKPKLIKNHTKQSETVEKKIKVNIWNEDEKITKDEKLDYDNEAYEMLHRAMPEWPCMSLDFLLPENFSGTATNFYSADKSRFNLSKDAFPYTAYMVAGSQTTGPNGFVYAMKWFNMHKTKYDDDPDKAADSDEEEGTEPYMKFEKAQVNGNINKLQAMRNSHICAIWSDSPSIEIVDLRSVIEDLEISAQMTKEEPSENNQNNIRNKNKKRKLNAKNITLKSFKRTNEGYALQWHHALPGVIAAGGQDKKIEIYLPSDENCSDWILNSSNSNNTTGILKGHKASVEGLAWSPSQNFVLASCSVDKSIRFWDLRIDKQNPPIVIDAAHESDVNCISWNTHCDFMVASGSDDNSFKVWDIRYVNNGPISHIKWHKAPITSIAWDPFDESQIAVSSEDNRLSIWDFSVEPDDNQLFDAHNQEIPQQLVFLHQGQENIKELKFHPLFKNLIVSTAENGINVFKPGFGGDEDSVASDDEDMNID